MQETYVQLTWTSLLPCIPIYTIGYGRRSIKDFLDLLHSYEIEFLIDIRSQPYSRANQQFSKDILEKTVKQHQIRYVFMGDSLGGRPDDTTCYVDGRVDYSKVREKEFYQHGISRLQIVWEKQIAVALMCSEMKPHECHRSKLVGNTLCNLDVEVAHIDEAGELKTQQEVNELLLGMQLSLFNQQELAPLFDGRMNFSRKKYAVQEEKKLF